MPEAANPTSEARLRKGNTRVTGKEQYYTPPALASQLVARVAGQVEGLSTRTIVEPAGGTGAFIEAARKVGAKEFFSVDIEPLHQAVMAGDFLQLDLPAISNAVTISNPPFGRNNSLSIPFFNRAAEISDYVCFIVPRSWRKWSVTNRLNRQFHLVDDVDIKIDYVDATGNAISQKNRLNTCFQIWQRRQEVRPLVKVKDTGLVTKTSPQDADVALTIFGCGCGALLTEFERKPNTTKMFLKLNHPKALAALKSVDYSRFYKNTAYTEALSLQEINYLLNEAVHGNGHLIETS